MPITTNSLLNSLRVGYNKVFEDAKAAAPSQWAKLATLVASTAASTTYGWLGQFPKLAEWTGQRAYKSMKEFGYSVTNKKYEASVKIPRTAFEDDTLDVYAPLFREMGYAAATHPDEIVFGLLAAGRTEDCYDGKKFFAADHPVYPNVDGTGSVVNTSNLLRPAAVESVVTDKTAWYLLDVSRPLKPFIFQERTKPEIETITSTANNTVFDYDEFPFGIRYRCNGGYGFWQQAVCSTQELNAANFAAALEAMQSFRADGGRPLGLGFGGEAGTMLVVPPSLQSAARRVVSAEQDPDGGSNIWYRAATLLVSHWLI